MFSELEKYMKVWAKLCRTVTKWKGIDLFTNKRNHNLFKYKWPVSTSLSFTYFPPEKLLLVQQNTHVQQILLEYHWLYL